MTSDFREGASSGQADLAPQDIRRIVLSRVEPDGVYLTGDVTNNFGISENTLKAWVQNGLKRVAKEKLGMKSNVYFGDLIIAYIRDHLE